MLLPQTAQKLAQWREDPDVLGVIWVGSRSRGHGDALSDDDLEVVLSERRWAGLTPEACLEAAYDADGKMVWDAQYVPRSDLERKRSSPLDLDRWPYEAKQVLFDRDGTLAPLVVELGTMGADFRRLRLLHATVDAQIASRRAQKTSKRGFDVAVRALVARGCKALSRVIFALEWRWVPLDHSLEPELETLADPAGAVPRLREAWVEGRPEPILDALQALEDALLAEGVPRRADRGALFARLVHPSGAAERAVHGLF